jgi:hypothetical protein
MCPRLPVLLMSVLASMIGCVSSNGSGSTGGDNDQASDTEQTCRPDSNNERMLLGDLSSLQEYESPLDGMLLWLYADSIGNSNSGIDWTGNNETDMSSVLDVEVDRYGRREYSLAFNQKGCNVDGNKALLIECGSAGKVKLTATDCGAGYCWEGQCMNPPAPVYTCVAKPNGVVYVDKGDVEAFDVGRDPQLQLESLYGDYQGFWDGSEIDIAKIIYVDNYRRDTSYWGTFSRFKNTCSSEYWLNYEVSTAPVALTVECPIKPGTHFGTTLKLTVEHCTKGCDGSVCKN